MRIHILLPYSIVAVLAFVCAGLCFLLPETKGTATLETMDSVNNNPSELIDKEKLSVEPRKEKEELGESPLNQGLLAWKIFFL